MTSVLDASTEARVAPALDIGARLPRVDLLPPEVGERRRLRRVKTAAGAAVGVTALLVCLAVAVTSSSARSAQAELDAETATGASLQADNADLREVVALNAQAKEARAVLSSAMGQEVRWSRVLDDLARTTPDNVWLREVAFVQGDAAVAVPVAAAPAATDEARVALGTATFAGTGYSHDDVAAWLEALQARPGYSDATVTSSSEKRVGTRVLVDFTSTATVDDRVLSGRWDLQETGR